MRLCFVSGAPWNATDSAQRYQQLVIAMRKLGVEADFFCPYESEPESPYLASEDKFYDFFIVGMPERRIWERRWNYKQLVLDICDAWDGQMVEGVDFSDEFYRLMKMADFIVAVSPLLAVKAQQIAPGKPTFIVSNGVREAVFYYKPKFAQKPKVMFWAAAYIGQNWWDLDTLFELPKLFNHIEFRYYFASDRDFRSNSPNLSVKVARRGVPFEAILNELTLPAIGLLPWRANDPVTWSADALKAYEYGVLGMTIVGVNCVISREIRDAFIAFGDTRKLLPMLLERALKHIQWTEPKVKQEEFQHWRWENRAKEYLEILEQAV